MPKRRLEFREVKTYLSGLRFDQVMTSECAAIGFKPVCDHPNYCKSDPVAIYLGQDHHVAYKPHRNDNRYWPSGFSEIKDNWNGLCSFTNHHGSGALCNIPLNSHSWRKPSAAVNRFMCARVAPFSAWLRNEELGERRYRFRVVTSGQRGVRADEMMRSECSKYGMKPVCDHPNYCKNDRRSLYIGQKHHIAHPSHRNKKGWFPSGWDQIKDNFFGVCMYTAHHGNGKALCNYPYSTHSWRAIGKSFNTFVCGKVLRFRKKLGAKNKVPARDYTFELVKIDNKAEGKRYSQVMIESCQKRGMKPVCDHPNYCRSDSKAIYLGQTHHLAYWPHRKNAGFWPEGWNDIAKMWDGMCAYTAHHGTGALCNIPGNTHSWQNPSDRANTFMCAALAGFTAELGSKNGVVGQNYEFRILQTDVRSGKFSDVMAEECAAVGMKPLCDHRSYCRNDKKSIYLGQDHHLAYRPHRQRSDFMPSGFDKIRKKFDGTCTYTSNRGPPGTTLCNVPANGHSWQKLSDKTNTFLCAKIIADDDKATEAACQLVKGYKLTPSAKTTKKERVSSVRKCERWCERTATEENGCEYENGICRLVEPKANDGKFDSNYAGYGCLFTRYSDLRKWAKSNSGIKVSKDGYSADIPKGTRLTSKKNYKRNIVISARMRANSAGSVAMSVFNQRNKVSDGITLETNNKKATAYPSKATKSIAKGNARWHSVRIVAYFWGVTEYYINGEQVTKTDKGGSFKDGKVTFFGNGQALRLKNVKIWELCGGKGVEKSNKEAHAKGKAQRDKIQNKLDQCNTEKKKFGDDVRKQQAAERSHNAKGNDMCRKRDNMRKERDNLKSQRDGMVKENDKANKEQKDMNQEQLNARSKRDTMKRNRDAAKEALKKAKDANKDSSAKCERKAKDKETEMTRKQRNQEDDWKGKQRKLQEKIDKDTRVWRIKVTKHQKIKAQVTLHRAQLKAKSETLYSRTKQCAKSIVETANQYRSKISKLNDRKEDEISQINKEMGKMIKEFKVKIRDAEKLGREKIKACDDGRKKDLGICAKEKEDQDKRWKLKYKNLDKFWDAKMAKEKLEGGKMVQDKYNKLLSRCKRMHSKEKAQCKEDYKECIAEGKRYKARRDSHMKLEKIALKMKEEADNNFKLEKKKYEGALKELNECIAETAKLDEAHEKKHDEMQKKLTEHLIHSAACMKRHKQSLKMIDNYKKMFRMIRNHVSSLRQQHKAEQNRVSKLRREYVEYENKCGRLEKGWKIKYHIAENKANQAKSDNDEEIKRYKSLDTELEAMDKRYEDMQRKKGESMKKWAARVDAMDSKGKDEEKSRKKALEEAAKKWEVEKKKMLQKNTESKKDYATRVEKARKAYMKQADEIEAGWRKIVKRLSQRTGESTQEFRARLKKLRDKHRQVAIYVGRYKAAKKAREEDIKRYKKEFKETTKETEDALEEGKKRLRRFKDEHANESEKVKDAVRRQNRSLREAEKSKRLALTHRSKLKTVLENGKKREKSITLETTRLKAKLDREEDSYQKKMKTTENSYSKKAKKTEDYWTKRLDIEKKAIQGATKNQIASDLRKILIPKYTEKVKSMKKKVKKLGEKKLKHKSRWAKKVDAVHKEWKPKVHHIEKGFHRKERQAEIEKDLVGQKKELVEEVESTCQIPEDARNFAEDNTRLRRLIAKSSTKLEKLRDDYLDERKKAKKLREGRKKQITDLSLIVSHLQEVLHKIDSVDGVKQTEGAPRKMESHVSNSDMTAPGVDEPFYTELKNA